MLIKELPGCPCEGDEDEHVESVALAWGDGRVDALPAVCAATGVNAGTAFADFPLVAYACDLADKPVCVFSSAVSMWQAGPDLFVFGDGEVDGGPTIRIARGTLVDASQEWLETVCRTLTPLDWKQAVATSVAGLLSDVPRDDDGWLPTSLFSQGPVDAELLFDIGLDLAVSGMRSAIDRVAAGEVAWASSIASDPEAARTWKARVADWVAVLNQAEDDLLPDEAVEALRAIYLAHELPPLDSWAQNPAIEGLRGHSQAGCTCDPARLRNAYERAATRLLPSDTYRPHDLDVTVSSTDDPKLQARLTSSAGRHTVAVGERQIVVPDLLAASYLAASVIEVPWNVTLFAGQASDAAAFLMPWPLTPFEADVDEAIWESSELGAFPAEPDDADAVARHDYELDDGSSSPGSDDSGSWLIMRIGGRYWDYQSDPGSWTLLDVTTDDEARAYLSSEARATE